MTVCDIQSYLQTLNRVEVRSGLTSKVTGSVHAEVTVRKENPGSLAL